MKISRKSKIRGNESSSDDEKIIIKEEVESNKSILIKQINEISKLISKKAISILSLLLILLFIIKNKVKINENSYSSNLYMFYPNNCSHNYNQIKKIEPDEKKEGIIFYVCRLCGKEYNKTIPLLNEDNYFIENIYSNCQHGNGKRYILKNNYNIKYEVTDNIRQPHTIYGSKCDRCHKNIGEFNFKKLGDVICDSYPRLYKLSSYWNDNWLLGGDNGTILCRRSEDQGKTWSEPVNVSNLPDHACSNVDFFELPTHEIICSYRAVGKDSENLTKKYNKKLFSSISKDGGRTWKDLGLIVDNYILAEKYGKTIEDAIKVSTRHKVIIGFYEPFVFYLNNKITLIYADDFTPAISNIMGKNYEDDVKVQSIYSVTFNMKTYKWSNERKILMNGYIKKTPTNSSLLKRPSRDGMPVVDIMKDGTYVMVFEGSYRDISYKYFTGEKLDEIHPFVILISYSKDGINWSNPTEVFVPKNNASKASAPYICINDNNQLIISFQTDEDSVTSGYIGDLYSVMKVIISKPGIKIEDINKDSFYAATNNYKAPIGSKSVWNGMMLVDNKIYAVSSGNHILYSEIPLYDNYSEYDIKLEKEYYVKKGKVNFNGNKIIIQKDYGIALLINKEIEINDNNTFYSHIIPNNSDNCGLIFGFNDEYKKDNYDYYAFLIKKNGYLSLEKFLNGQYIKLEPIKNILIDNFNNNNEYKMSVKFNLSSGQILANINDNINNIDISSLDKDLKGNKIGLICDGNGAILTQILID